MQLKCIGPIHFSNADSGFNPNDLALVVVGLHQTAIREKFGTKANRNRKMRSMHQWARAFDVDTKLLQPYTF